jgi:hypothetical protein
MTVAFLLLVLLLAALHLRGDNHWEIRALHRFVGPKVGQGRRSERWEFHFMEKRSDGVNALQIAVANDRVLEKRLRLQVLFHLIEWFSSSALSTTIEHRAEPAFGVLITCFAWLLLSVLEFPFECCNTTLRQWRFLDRFGDLITLAARHAWTLRADISDLHRWIMTQLRGDWFAPRFREAFSHRKSIKRTLGGVHPSAIKSKNPTSNKRGKVEMTNNTHARVDPERKKSHIWLPVNYYRTEHPSPGPASSSSPLEGVFAFFTPS